MKSVLKVGKFCLFIYSSRNLVLRYGTKLELNYKFFSVVLTKIFSPRQDVFIHQPLSYLFVFFL